MAEQRGGKRVACDARFLGAGAEVLRGDVTDISDSGLCLLTHTEIPKGTSLHLDFMLQTGAVEAVGEVRWVKRGATGYEVGVRFVRINAPSLRAIEAAKAVAEL